MRTLDRRIRKLEDRFGTGDSQRISIRWVVYTAGRSLALDHDRCIQILDECGFLPKCRFSVVNLCKIPDGLNAEELGRFLRGNGGTLRQRRCQNQPAPASVRLHGCRPSPDPDDHGGEEGWS